MFSKKSIQFIAQFFLFAFILIKASGLHAFVHVHDSTDDIDQCTICHLNNRDDSTPVISFEAVGEFILWNDFQYVENFAYFYNLPSEKLSISELFNKPPPIQ